MYKIKEKRFCKNWDLNLRPLIRKINPLPFGYQWCCDMKTSIKKKLNFRCFGKELKEIPSDLPNNLQRLTISDSNIKNLSRNAFQPYRDTLMDV